MPMFNVTTFDLSCNEGPISRHSKVVVWIIHFLVVHDSFRINIVAVLLEGGFFFAVSPRGSFITEG